MLKDKYKFWEIGIQDDGLGSYSTRKGLCSFVYIELTNSSPIMSFCLCAQWSTGSIKEWYFHYKRVSDQYFGLVIVVWIAVDSCLQCHLQILVLILQMPRPWLQKIWMAWWHPLFHNLAVFASSVFSGFILLLWPLFAI